MGRSTFSDLVNPTHAPLNHRGQCRKKSERLVKSKWRSGVSLIYSTFDDRVRTERRSHPPVQRRRLFFGIAPFLLYASACGRRIYAIFISLLFSLWARNPFPRSEVDNRRGQVNCGLVRGRSAHESPGMIWKKIGWKKTDRIVTSVSFGEENGKKRFLKIIIFRKYYIMIQQLKLIYKF